MYLSQNIHQIKYCPFLQLAQVSFNTVEKFHGDLTRILVPARELALFGKFLDTFEHLDPQEQSRTVQINLHVIHHDTEDLFNSAVCLTACVRELLDLLEYAYERTNWLGLVRVAQKLFSERHRANQRIPELDAAEDLTESKE